MELRTTRAVLGAKVTTFDRRDKVRHKKKESYKGSILAKNQIKYYDQDLLNSIQAKNWQRANFDLSAKIKEREQKRRLKMKQAGKAWKLKNKNNNK